MGFLSFFRSSRDIADPDAVTRDPETPYIAHGETQRASRRLAVDAHVFDGEHTMKCAGISGDRMRGHGHRISIFEAGHPPTVSCPRGKVRPGGRPRKKCTVYSCHRYSLRC